RELTDQSVEALLALELIEDHQVVEARQRGKAGGDGRRLVNGEALGQVLAKHYIEVPAGPGGLGERGADGGECKSSEGCPYRDSKSECPHRDSSPSRRSPATGRATPRAGRLRTPAGSPRGTREYTRRAGRSQLLPHLWELTRCVSRACNAPSCV